jgi:hypothetical protein
MTFLTEDDQIVVFGPGEKKLRDNFERFHRENPHVYELLVSLAREWKAARPGRRCGMKMLFERCRWDLNVKSVGEPIVLNNNYHAFYARLIMEQETDLADLFETRRQRG